MESSNDFCIPQSSAGCPDGERSATPRALQRWSCCPGRGDGNIVWAVRDGNVRAVRHLLRTKPGSLQETDRHGLGSRSHPICRPGYSGLSTGLEAKPEKLLNLQAVTHQDHQGGGYIRIFYRIIKACVDPFWYNDDSFCICRLTARSTHLPF